MMKNKYCFNILIMSLAIIILSAMYSINYVEQRRKVNDITNDFESYKELQNEQYTKLQNDYNLVLEENNKLFQENKRLSDTNTTLEKLISKQAEQLKNHKGESCNKPVEKKEIIGEPYRETNLSTETTEEPNTEDNTPAPEEPNANPDGMTYVGVYELTAYTHTGNPMANGQMPFVGAVACNSLALGTVIYIEGYGTFTVCDTGGMGGGVIDIFMDSYDECIQFGRRSANVYIVN